MALYKDTCGLLIGEVPTKEFYRFEGAKTCSRFDPKNNPDSSYIYISSSQDHHMYFTMRRLKQMLNERLIKEEEIPFISKTIRSCEEYPRIKNLVLHGEALEELYSHRFVCASSFHKLLKDNSIRSNQPKPDKRLVERVDRRVYGGGYGIAEEWKELFAYLTYFSATTRISRNDVMDIIIQMRRTGKITYKDHMASIVSDTSRYSYQINPYILSDFNKFDIMDAIERIVEKGLVTDNSELSTSPRKVEREVLEEYERGREKVLTLLDRRRF